MNAHRIKSWYYLVVLAFLISALSAGENDPVASWNMEDTGAGAVLETVKQVYDSVYGFRKHVEGVEGQALLFDGYTTYIRKSAALTPDVSDAFTIEAWIAFQSYPWNWVAIVDQKKDSTAGYYLGVNANGFARLQAVVDGKLVTVDSPVKMDLLKWYHLAASYDEQNGLHLYINGKHAGNSTKKGDLVPARTTDMLIGRNHQKLPPAYPIRLDLPASYSFDGIIDEVNIYPDALSPDKISDLYESKRPENQTALSYRKLPVGPEGPGRFGAYYTKLEFSETWDHPWRVGPHADVVVRFDQSPYKFVFWRGTSYIPFWVTENGIWYTNEFNETWGEDVLGCAEPMSDKQTRHSHVRIVENTDARVVVHWRYALVDNRYVIAKQDPVTGWGDWSDEYYTIYPDGVGLRKIHLWSSEPTKPHQFQEAIILNPPGTKPEDNIEVEAVTMVNMKGETHSYSWAEGPPEALDKPDRANIQFINLKAESVPFLVVNEGKPSVTRHDIKTDGPWLKPYRGEINREYSIFPWWNHWPVAQIPSDGRWATEPDRVSHSSLSNDLEWKELELTERSHVRVMMHGLTDKNPQDIIPLANSWLYPPELVLEGDGFENKGYAEEERAWMLERESGKSARKLTMKLRAEPGHPVLNPAFIIANWGEQDAALEIDGKPVPRGATFRYGHRHTLTGSDLIVWLKMHATSPVEIRLSAKEN